MPLPDRSQHVDVVPLRGRIDSGGAPLTMRLAHPIDEATAPVTDIVGRLTRVWQDEEGRARFEAQLADTPNARTVASLLDSSAGQPFLRGVSIRGRWIGQPRKVSTGSGLAETADDLEFDGLDFTHRPGVAGAAVERVAAAVLAGESARERWSLLESVTEAKVTIRETDQVVDPAVARAAELVERGEIHKAGELWDQIKTDYWRARFDALKERRAAGR